MENIFLFLAIGFDAFAIGRISHIYGGSIEGPHHWIYGLAAIFVGLLFIYNFWGLMALSFGLGLFVSDIKDFCKKEFYGVDKDGPKRFWDID